VIVGEYTLPEVPRPRWRYEVTVTLPRPTDVEALLPGGQAAVDITAAAIAAEGLLTAWTCRQSVVSMIVDLPSMADALAAGAHMARVLGSGDGLASVTAQPIASFTKQTEHSCGRGQTPGLSLFSEQSDHALTRQDPERWANLGTYWA
jgi:hypothetical protein